MRITGSFFLVEVPKRDAATLIPIIEEYICPGSTIYSDEWRAYSSIPTMHGYSHCTVNHSQNFVHPDTGAHTQQIESMWSQVKKLMREGKTMNSTLFETYLPEFMWRKKYDYCKCKPFSNFIHHSSTIKEQYPLH